MHGPGTSRSDSIPARLSKGEYVLPADTVAKIGKGTLDQLRAATHTFADNQPPGAPRAAPANNGLALLVSKVRRLANGGIVRDAWGNSIGADGKQIDNTGAAALQPGQITRDAWGNSIGADGKQIDTTGSAALGQPRAAMGHRVALGGQTPVTLSTSPMPRRAPVMAAPIEPLEGFKDGGVVKGLRRPVHMAEGGFMSDTRQKFSDLYDYVRNKFSPNGQGVGPSGRVPTNTIDPSLEPKLNTAGVNAPKAAPGAAAAPEAGAGAGEVVGGAAKFGLRRALGVAGAAYTGWDIGSRAYDKMAPKVQDAIGGTIDQIAGGGNSTVYDPNIGTFNRFAKPSVGTTPTPETTDAPTTTPAATNAAAATKPASDQVPADGVVTQDPLEYKRAGVNKYNVAGGTVQTFPGTGRTGLPPDNGEVNDAIAAGDARGLRRAVDKQSQDAGDFGGKSRGSVTVVPGQYFSTPSMEQVHAQNASDVAGEERSEGLRRRQESAQAAQLSSLQEILSNPTKHSPGEVAHAQEVMATQSNANLDRQIKVQQLQNEMGWKKAELGINAQRVQNEGLQLADQLGQNRYNNFMSDLKAEFPTDSKDDKANDLNRAASVAMHRFVTASGFVPKRGEFGTMRNLAEIGQELNTEVERQTRLVKSRMTGDPLQATFSFTGGPLMRSLGLDLFQPKTMKGHTDDAAQSLAKLYSGLRTYDKKTGEITVDNKTFPLANLFPETEEGASLRARFESLAASVAGQ